MKDPFTDLLQKIDYALARWDAAKRRAGVTDEMIAQGTEIIKEERAKNKD